MTTYISLNTFKEKLDREYNWPALYTFKFIVPKGTEDKIKALFVNHDTSEKHSSKGNYISVTARIMAESSQKVLKYYVEASKIEGVIAL